MRRHDRNGVRRVGLRDAGSLRLALVVLALGVSAAGYALMSAAVHSDRRTAASERAGQETVAAQLQLERASAYVLGLGELLANDQSSGGQRFDFLASTTGASFELIDALWIQGSGGSPVARYATTLAPGTKLPPSSVLAAQIRNSASMFGITTATPLGVFGGQPGFFLVEGTRFGHGPGSSGYLAVFVPRGWMTLSLGGDPRQVAVALDGQSLEGQLSGPVAAATSFQALTQRWSSAEVAELFEADSARLLRYEDDGTATVVAARNGPLVDLPVGTGLTLEGESVAAAVRRSAQSARIQDFSGLPGSIAERNRMAGLHSALGAPVVVEGALWGVMVVAWARREGASAAVEARVSRSRTLTLAPNWSPRARGSWRRPTRHGIESSATSTTTPNSGSCR